MFLTSSPIGVNPPRDEDRIHLWQVTNGDDWHLTTKLYVPPHFRTPADPNNSKVVFMLSENRFARRPYWTGTWGNGITPTSTPGLVTIRVPDKVTSELRRGVYSFSMSVADAFGKNVTTVLVGNVQVEYEPTSPNHSIPYKNGEGGRYDSPMYVQVPNNADMGPLNPCNLPESHVP